MTIKVKVPWILFIVENTLFGCGFGNVKLLKESLTAFKDQNLGVQTSSYKFSQLFQRQTYKTKLSVVNTHHMFDFPTMSQTARPA